MAEVIRCRSCKSGDCYDGKPSERIYGEGGSMADDGTFDGSTVVCDACYIGIGQPGVAIDDPRAETFGSTIEGGQGESPTVYGIKLITYCGAPYVGKRSGGPEWLTWFDFDAHDPRNTDEHPYPTGDGDSSPNPEDAMAFKTVEEAREFWQGTSTITPTRPDGKPNRPMTVFTIEVEELPRP